MDPCHKSFSYPPSCIHDIRWPGTILQPTHPHSWVDGRNPDMCIQYETDIYRYERMRDYGTDVPRAPHRAEAFPGGNQVLGRYARVPPTFLDSENKVSLNHVLIQAGPVKILTQTSGVHSRNTKRRSIPNRRGICQSYQKDIVHINPNHE